MPKLIKYRFKLYKRFELDIWGLLNNNPTFGHPIVRFFQDSYRYRAEKARRKYKQFIYRIDVINPDKAYKRRKWRFVSMQLIKFFYRGVNQKRVFGFSRLASSTTGLWVENFLLLVESRISTFLYRVNWIPNILFMKQFLSHGNVLIDSKLSLNSDVLLKPFQVVQLSPASRLKIRPNLLARLNMNMIYFTFPRYSFVNYKIMFAILYRSPKLLDLSFPVLLDIYRLNDLN